MPRLRERRKGRRGQPYNQNQPEVDKLPHDQGRSSSNSFWKKSEPRQIQSTQSYFDKLYGTGQVCALNFTNKDDYIERDKHFTGYVISRRNIHIHSRDHAHDVIINFVSDDDIYGQMDIMENAGHLVKQEYDNKRSRYSGYGLTKTAAGEYQGIKAILYTT